MGDHYEKLGLLPDASNEDITRAIETIRKRIGGYAPGVLINDEIIRLNYPEMWSAFLVLSDPEKKAAYDAQRTPLTEKDVEPEPAQLQNFRMTFLSYAAAAGLLGAIIMFLALLGGLLI